MIAFMYFEKGAIKVFLRSDYFKTAEDFKAVVGDTTKVFEVKECPHHVLETVINFMYGIDLPDTFRTTLDAECLLTMADIYLMEDLKDAVASHLAPLLDKDNILDIYHLSEKYTAQKLNEACCNCIATSIEIANIAKQVLGVDATAILNMRKDNSKVIKKDMIVRCMRTTIWWTDHVTKISKTSTPASSPHWYDVEAGTENNFYEVKAGTVGRIIDGGSDEKISVKWNLTKCGTGDSYHAGTIRHMEILTPPIDTTLFKD